MVDYGSFYSDLTEQDKKDLLGNEYEINESGEIDSDYVSPPVTSIHVSHPEGACGFHNFQEFRKRSKEQMREALKK